MKKHLLALALLLPCLLCGAEPGKTEPEKTEPEKTGQEKTGQEKTGQEKTGQEKAAVVRPRDMTPEELARRTNELYELDKGRQHSLGGQGTQGTA